VQHVNSGVLLYWVISFLRNSGTLDEAESNLRGFWLPVIGFYGAQIWLIADYFVLPCRLAGETASAQAHLPIALENPR